MKRTTNLPRLRPDLRRRRTLLATVLPFRRSSMRTYLPGTDGRARPRIFTRWPFARYTRPSRRRPLRKLSVSLPAFAMPIAKAGKLTLNFRNGLRREGRVYLAKGQRVKIRGRARPSVPGKYVRIELRRKGKTVASKVRRLRRSGRNRGKFVVRFIPRARGAYVVRARHKGTRRQRAFSERKGARVLDNTAGFGSRGIRVRMLQR